MNNEIWKDIDGYEGRYQISSIGRIRGLVNTRGNPLSEPKILKPRIQRKGYLEVCLKIQQKRKMFKIHRLVAAAFLPNPMNKPQVNHINGIKTDNRAQNLEWATPSENMQHAFENGLNIPAWGETCPQSLLTNDDAEKIRNEYKKYSRNFNRKALAKKYGVSLCVIKNIVNGKTYIKRRKQQI